MEQTTPGCDQSSGVYRRYHVTSERMAMALFAIILALVVSEEHVEWFRRARPDCTVYAANK